MFWRHDQKIKTLWFEELRSSLSTLEMGPDQTQPKHTFDSQ